MKKYFQAPWTTKDVILALLGTISLGLIVYSIADGTQFFRWMDRPENQSLGMILVYLTMWLIVVTPILIIAKIKKKLNLKSFGITNIGAWKTIKLIFWGYLLFMGITIAIGMLILYTEVRVPGYQIQERILPILGEDLRALFISGIIIIIIAPILEEIIFRGFLLTALVNKIGMAYGSLITAGVFAFSHLQPHSFIPIFILGLSAHNRIMVYVNGLLRAKAVEELSPTKDGRHRRLHRRFTIDIEHDFEPLSINLRRG